MSLSIMILHAESFSEFGVVGPLADSTHPRQIIRGAGQRPLSPPVGQPSLTKPPHASLLFQHSVHGFHDGFASGVHRAACRIPQLASHAGMRRSPGRVARRPPTIQAARQIRVRYVAVNVSFLQSPQVLHREKSAVRAGAARPFSTVLLHQIHQGQQQIIVIGLLRHALPHNQVILTHRQRARVAQREPAPLAQKTAVGIGARKFFHPPVPPPLPAAREFPALAAAVARSPRGPLRCPHLRSDLPRRTASANGESPAESAPVLLAAPAQYPSDCAKRLPQCASSRWPHAPTAPTLCPAPIPPRA